MAGSKSDSIDLVGLPFQVHVSPEDFDTALQAHGVPFIHWKAMRCPIGLATTNDTRRVDDCPAGCSNGFVYTKAGTVLLTASGNNTKLTQYDPGLLTGSTISVTAPRYYVNSNDLVQLLQYDRLFLPESTMAVPMWELAVAHESGIDRLRFPVVEVVDLMDNQGVRYTKGDFTISDGKIFWLGKRPGIDPNTGFGRVYSVRYLYQPYWVVSQLLHEVRVATVDDPATGEQKVVRMPQSALLQREFINNKDSIADSPSLNPLDPRAYQSPPSGGFSVR